MTNPVAMSKPNYVYRAWDSYGHLLYIGCSVDPHKRMKGHKGTFWVQYAETLSIVGPWDFKEARRRESEAIATEGSYFNVTQPEMDARKLCIGAAKRALYDRRDFPPEYDIALSRSEDGDRWFEEEYMPRWEGWRDRLDDLTERFKKTRFPYMNDTERRARYLAAREDAELARTEERAA